MFLFVDAFLSLFVLTGGGGEGGGSDGDGGGGGGDDETWNGRDGDGDGGGGGGDDETWNGGGDDETWNARMVLSMETWRLVAVAGATVLFVVSFGDLEGDRGR